MNGRGVASYWLRGVPLSLSDDVFEGAAASAGGGASPERRRVSAASIEPPACSSAPSACSLENPISMSCLLLAFGAALLGGGCAAADATSTDANAGGGAK